MIDLKCRFCDGYCFIQIPVYFSKEIQNAFFSRGINIMATCKDGVEFDSKLLGINLEDIELLSNEKIVKKVIYDAPVLKGKKIVFHGIDCLWWTTDVKHTDTTQGIGLCPFCGGPLRIQELNIFMENAYSNPLQYGSEGLMTLLKAHHKYTNTCRVNWNRYNAKVKKIFFSATKKGHKNGFAQTGTYERIME